jgi:hypothetical protein
LPAGAFVAGAVVTFLAAARAGTAPVTIPGSSLPGTVLAPCDRAPPIGRERAYA